MVIFNFQVVPGPQQAAAVQPTMIQTENASRPPSYTETESDGATLTQHEQPTAQI